MPPSGHLLPSKEHPLRVEFRSLCNIREDKNLCKILRFCTKINSPIPFRQPTSFRCNPELITLLQMNNPNIYIILSTQSRVIGFNRCRSFEKLISIAAQLIKMRNKNRKEIFIFSYLLIQFAYGIFIFDTRIDESDRFRSLIKDIITSSFVDLFFFFFIALKTENINSIQKRLFSFFSFGSLATVRLARNSDDKNNNHLRQYLLLFIRSSTKKSIELDESYFYYYTKTLSLCNFICLKQLISTTFSNNWICHFQLFLFLFEENLKQNRNAISLLLYSRKVFGGETKPTKHTTVTTLVLSNYSNHLDSNILPSLFVDFVALYSFSLKDNYSDKKNYYSDIDFITKIGKDVDLDDPLSIYTPYDTEKTHHPVLPISNGPASFASSCSHHPTVSASGCLRVEENKSKYYLPTTHATSLVLTSAFPQPCADTTIVSNVHIALQHGNVGISFRTCLSVPITSAVPNLVLSFQGLPLSSVHAKVVSHPLCRLHYGRSSNDWAMETDSIANISATLLRPHCVSALKQLLRYKSLPDNHIKCFNVVFLTLLLDEAELEEQARHRLEHPQCHSEYDTVLSTALMDRYWAAFPSLLHVTQMSEYCLILLVDYINRLYGKYVALRLTFYRIDGSRLTVEFPAKCHKYTASFSIRNGNVYQTDKNEANESGAPDDCADGPAANIWLSSELIHGPRDPRRKAQTICHSRITSLRQADPSRYLSNRSIQAEFLLEISFFDKARLRAVAALIVDDTGDSLLSAGAVSAPLRSGKAIKRFLKIQSKLVRRFLKIEGRLARKADVNKVQSDASCFVHLESAHTTVTPSIESFSHCNYIFERPERLGNFDYALPYYYVLAQYISAINGDRWQAYYSTASRTDHIFDSLMQAYFSSTGYISGNRDYSRSRAFDDLSSAINELVISIHGKGRNELFKFPQFDEWYEYDDDPDEDRVHKTLIRASKALLLEARYRSCCRAYGKELCTIDCTGHKELPPPSQCNNSGLINRKGEVDYELSYDFALELYIHVINQPDRLQLFAASRTDKYFSSLMQAYFSSKEYACGNLRCAFSDLCSTISNYVLSRYGEGRNMLFKFRLLDEWYETTHEDDGEERVHDILNRLYEVLILEAMFRSNSRTSGKDLYTNDYVGHEEYPPFSQSNFDTNNDLRNNLVSAAGFQGCINSDCSSDDPCDGPSNDVHTTPDTTSHSTTTTAALAVPPVSSALSPTICLAKASTALKNSSSSALSASSTSSTGGASTTSATALPVLKSELSDDELSVCGISRNHCAHPPDTDNQDSNDKRPSPNLSNNKLGHLSEVTAGLTPRFTSRLVNPQTITARVAVKHPPVTHMIIQTNQTIAVHLNLISAMEDSYDTQARTKNHSQSSLRTNSLKQTSSTQHYPRSASPDNIENSFSGTSSENDEYSLKGD